MNDLGAERLLEHADGLRALARRLVGADRADDVVQETFAAALRSPPDPDRPARPWLGRVLRNVAKMRSRSDARRVLREEAIAVEPVTANDPAQIVERLEVHRAVSDILVALDEPYRTTLVLHYYDGLSLAEIARKDSVPEATVRWRHKQALDRLRARLDERSGGDRRAWVAALAPLVGARPLVMGGLLVKKLLVGLALLVLVLLIGLKFIAGNRVEAPRTTAAARPVKIEFRAPPEPALLAGSAQTASGETTAGTLGATRIVGRVVDDQARPVANATVWLGEIGHKSARAALSGADGRFAIGGLRPGRFQLLASSGDLVGAPDEVALPFGKTREIELVVRAGKVELGGRIIDEAGRGIANAAVDLRGAVARTTRTDGEGRFRVAGLVAGVYEVAASADDFVRAQVSKLVTREADANVTLKLARGVVVTGFVRTAAGTPVAGAAVGSTAWNLHDPRLDVESDARGQFRVGPLPSGSTRLSAFHPDHGVSEIATVELPPGSAPAVDLVFASSAAIEGSVRLDDGTPAAGAAVTVTASDTPARWSIDADAAGHFALGSLPVGDYMISATSQPDVAPQAAPSATKRIKLAQGARDRVELQIVGGSEHVRGRVVDEQGTPVAGAAVWVELASLTMSPTALDNVHSYSGPDGAFDLRGLARGDYHVYAAHPDHATGRAADVRAGASDVTVALRAAASISGRAVTADGKPLRSFHLRWKWNSRKGQYGEVFSMGRRMIEDPDGRFAIDGLEPTPLFTVSIETASGATGDATPFPLAEGERKTDLEIQAMGDGTVRGRVIDRNTGRPAIGLVVFFPSLSLHAESPVDGNGRFEAQVPAGSYPYFHVQSETQGYPEVERPFIVKPGETTELGDVQVDLR